jgi:RNA polymerase sigma-70 factor (ECF subfamily)
LLIRLRDTSQHEAWQEFVGIYEPLVYRLARRKGFQHADALDLAQEVFTAVGKAIERFDPRPEKGSFRGWLFRIARNLMINFISRQKGERGTGDSAIRQLLSEQPATDEQATTLFRLEYRREVFRWAAGRVRGEFTEDTWRAFWLTRVDGESIEDVARMLGKSPGAVRIARSRVLARLKQEAARFDEQEGNAEP